LSEQALSWRPGASLAALKTRAAMLGRAREFFAQRCVLEVETPILSAATVSDPQLQSLHTQVAGIAAPRYLQTSPEYAMKRLLAAGSGDIYQVCKVFRDEEQGRWHNPEFTLIEWYRSGFDDAALMDEVEALLARVLEGLRDLPSAERLSYSAALQRHAGVDAFDASDDDLAAAAVRHGIHCDSTLDRDAKLDLLMGLVVGPRLGVERPCFVCDYPVSQAALARLKPGNLAAAHAVAARFELYWDGVELANGFHELANTAEQRARFMADLKIRATRGLVQPPLDENLLAALQHGLPDCAGVALGFDRLVAIALGAKRLSEAMSFTIENS
jgi:elongation factor P--(R)-beta-lysine ligase